MVQICVSSPLALESARERSSEVKDIIDEREDLMGILGPETLCRRHPLQPLSQSRRACPLHLEHPHLLEENGAGHVALHQREAGPVDAQAREMDVSARSDS